LLVTFLLVTFLLAIFVAKLLYAMKNIPFVFGKIAENNDFTNREKEVEKLKNNFVSLTNTTIISPRRWGKTSLVNKVSQLVTSENKHVKVAFVDVFNVRNEEGFYLALVKSVLDATSSKWEEMAENAKQFLSQLIPTISFSNENIEISFGLGWEGLRKHADDMLHLAERIAIKRKIRLIVCIDEFQTISEFKEPLAFQRKLRAHWQKHAHVGYCLYGSKRHMLLGIFSNYSMPFYKFGDLMFLEKIETSVWQDFITRRFKDTNKRISGKNARLIAELAENHPYYVQQLAQQSWLLCDRECSEDEIINAKQNIINQLSLLFINIVESLSTMQRNLLKAILAGEKQLSSQCTLAKYNLGTSAAIPRLRKSLLEREIIDINPKNEIELQDPMFKAWLKQINKGPHQSE